MSTRVGMIGAGIMGLAMASNLKKAGFSVVVTSRSEARRQQAHDTGLPVLKTPMEVAAASEIIITMVTDPKAVGQTLTAPDGILKANVKGKTLLQMSTLDEPSTLIFAALADKSGMAFLDCPVAGSKVQASQAQLILLAGGDATLVDACRPVLMAMGKAIVHAGPVGKGTALKLCMNLIVAQMTTALCESVVLAETLGVDPARVFDVIGHSPALNCGYYQIKQKALLGHDFSPAFSLDNMLKDVRFMDDAAQKKNKTLPVTKAVRALMEEAALAGLGEEDLIAIVKKLRG